MQYSVRELQMDPHTVFFCIFCTVFSQPVALVLRPVRLDTEVTIIDSESGELSPEWVKVCVCHPRYRAV